MTWACLRRSPLIHTAVRDGNIALASRDLTTVADRLGAVLAMTEVLGINPLDWQRTESTDLLATVDGLVRLACRPREDARSRRDYAAADGIRDQLAAAGVVVEDTPTGAALDFEGTLTWPATRAGRALSASRRRAPRRVGRPVPAGLARAGADPTRRGPHRASGGPAGGGRVRFSGSRDGRGDWRLRARRADAPELVVGRNAVAEALRAKVPVTALYVAIGIEADERVTESVRLAGNRGISLVEVSRAELDRMTGGLPNQGLAAQVPPFRYVDLPDVLARRGRGSGASTSRRGRRRDRPAQSRGADPFGRRVRRPWPGRCRLAGQPGSRRRPGARRRGRRPAFRWRR